MKRGDLAEGDLVEFTAESSPSPTVGRVTSTRTTSGLVYVENLPAEVGGRVFALWISPSSVSRVWREVTS